MENMIKIRVCMGSSCYPRGNREVLKRLKIYIKENRLNRIVDLRGNLCIGLCKKGANVTVDEKIYNNVTADSIIEILNHALEERGLL